MSGQLQLRNCKNRYDTRQTHRNISSPGSEIRVTGRGRFSAGSNSRSSKPASLSLSQHNKLPPQNVNKAGKKDKVRQAHNARGASSSLIPQPKNQTIHQAGGTVQPTNTTMGKTKVSPPVRCSSSEKQTSCIIAPDSGPATESSHSPATSEEEVSPDRSANQVSSPNISQTKRGVSSVIPDDCAAQTSSNLQDSSSLVELSVRTPSRKLLSHSASDPCLISRTIESNSSPGGEAKNPTTSGNFCPTPCNQFSQLLPDQASFDQFTLFLESNPSAPWHMAFHQLKTMGGRMSQLDSIQETTTTLKSQMDQVLGRTLKLEKHVQQNDSEIDALRQDIEHLKQTVSNQNETIHSLKQAQQIRDSQTDQQLLSFKQSLDKIEKNSEQQISQIKQSLAKREQSTEQQLSKVKQLVDRQEKKTEQLSSLRHKIKAETQDTLTQHEQLVAYNALKDKAFANRNNLVITGIAESEQYSPVSQITHFLKTQLKLEKLSIASAYRLGKEPRQGSSYSRPLLVKFKYNSDRNLVWRKRKEIKQGNDGNISRIQSDLPRQLREDLHIMYRVVNAASNYENLHMAEVKDYKILLNSQEYSAKDLEDLPEEIRPSTISTRYSDTTLVFFTKYTCLSNHFPSPFKIGGQVFGSMEHFLAFKRAQLSEDPQLIQQASNIRDPLDAKAMLNQLKNDHVQDWKEKAPNYALQGLREKFKQNPRMADYLCSTQPLHLGEASTNPVWGTGLQLDAADTLNQSKWIKTGNLLGKTLMKIRNEIVQERGRPDN